MVGYQGGEDVGFLVALEWDFGTPTYKTLKSPPQAVSHEIAAGAASAAQEMRRYVIWQLTTL